MPISPKGIVMQVKGVLQKRGTGIGKETHRKYRQQAQDSKHGRNIGKNEGN